jgi:hypothetical protein
MKFTITESKLNNMMLQYLDKMNLTKVQKGPNHLNKIWFVNDLDDKSSMISYDTKTKFCTINYSLLEDLTNFFSLPTGMSALNIVIKWVEQSVNDVLKDFRVFSMEDYTFD